MNTTLHLKKTTKILIIVVIVVHCMFFLLEAILWMRPEVHTTLIGLLNNPVSSDYELQALTLKNLFINQGFYNLFLAGGGIAGWRLIKRGHMSAGYTMLIFLCFAATGAGIILASSTRAYMLATLQALPAFIALVQMYPAFRDALKISQDLVNK